jgi:hypothetical protein
VASDVGHQHHAAGEAHRTDAGGGRSTIFHQASVVGRSSQRQVAFAVLLKAATDVASTANRCRRLTISATAQTESGIVPDEKG